MINSILRSKGSRQKFVAIVASGVYMTLICLMTLNSILSAILVGLITSAIIGVLVFFIPLLLNWINAGESE